ncbi:MAG: DUF1573 domain-containing protein [Flavobacteriales bacterium]
MKKLLSFACAALLGTAALAQTGPMIQVDKDVHDYGNIQQGANGECVFTVTNTGDAPLILTNCKGSCGCTVPKCDTAPIAPGQKSSITVRYDTKRTGPINKSVTISSNAVNEADKVVRIKGMVEGNAADGGNQ